MTKPPKNAKSCGTQLLPSEAPAHDWSLDRLSSAAASEYAAICAGERRHTAGYWRLGQLLSLARKQFHHGQWAAYLKHLAIDKSRAAKAMRIFETFATAEQTGQLTVAEAYEQRQRRPRAAKQTTKRKPASTPLAQREAARSWPEFAAVILAEVERQRDEAEFLTPGEVTAALDEVSRAAAALHQLAERLRQRSVVAKLC